jgi:hypothetical protein
MRNPIAKNMHKFNKPQVVKARKGKGSFKREKGYIVSHDY